MTGLEQKVPMEQSAQTAEHLMETPEIFRKFEQFTQSAAERPHSNMEHALHNLEKLEEKAPRTGMEQVFRNLEAMERKEDSGNLEHLRDLEAAKEVWHQQERDNTCAIACSGFIINEFKGTDVTEGELRGFVESQGWMREGGISLISTHKLLEAYGVENRLMEGASYAELKEALSGRDRVIVGVNNVSICTEWCDQYPALSANHAIEVLDIDESDPKDVKVIINDPGVKDGCGKAVGLENFLDAWRTGNNVMLTAFRG